MKFRDQERAERILQTIDRLGAVTIKQLFGIHNFDLKSYRNACLVVQKLEPYLNTTFLNKEKVIYLNKKGRDFIGSNREIKQGHHIEHTILRNSVYIHLGKPVSWEIEKVIEYETTTQKGIIVTGFKVSNKTKLVADASYIRNGYTHLVEIDNKADMKDNLKKIKAYKEAFPSLNTPRLEVFTTTETRKNNFNKWILEYQLRGEAKTFSEIT